jgi:hypothetical protein
MSNQNNEWYLCTLFANAKSILLYQESTSESCSSVMEFLTLCIQYNSRIRVQTSVDEITPIRSAVSMFPSAG